MALPTGSSRVGQYDAFEGAAGSLVRGNLGKMGFGAFVGVVVGLVVVFA